MIPINFLKKWSLFNFFYASLIAQPFVNFTAKMLDSLKINISIQEINFLKTFFASIEIGVSGGKTRVCCQFITFRYVPWGVSEQNGGYPISISYMITPRDHQSLNQHYYNKNQIEK